MVILSLFELFLLVFAIYTLLNCEGGMKTLVLVLCLVAVCLFERLRERMKEDNKAKKRLLKYGLGDSRKGTMKRNYRGGILN